MAMRADDRGPNPPPDDQLTWSAGDRMPRGVSAVQDRLGLTWVRRGKFWRVEGANGHDVTWNYLVNNRGPLLSRSKR